MMRNSLYHLAAHLDNWSAIFPFAHKYILSNAPQLFHLQYTRCCCCVVMAVIRFTDSEPPLRIMSPQSLFYGLFFGLGGGILFLVIFVGLVYWRCARSGRIRLGSGAPGQLDDEQRLLEDERAAMEQLDPNQQEAYYRAKGTTTPFVSYMGGAQING
jgi:hypothetical protein